MPSFDENQTSVRFSTTVPPDGSRTLSKQIDKPASAEQLNIRFYQGPELDLEVKPVRQTENEQLPLVDLIGRDVIVGDDDVFSFAISEPLNTGDEIVVELTNKSSEYSYDATVDVLVDYLGGTQRTAGFLGRLLN